MPRLSEHDPYSFIRAGVVRSIHGETYRWVTAAFPLPPNGPDANHCATAGSYITGQRMNGKGVHGVLYTSPDEEVAAIEVWEPPQNLSQEKAVRYALEGLENDGFQLFKITFNLTRVLDLTNLTRAQLRFLHHPEFEQERSCRLLSRPGIGQRLGWVALQSGFDGILRPSTAYWRRWGSEAAKRALVLDIFCPNLKRGLGWKQVV